MFFIAVPFPRKMARFLYFINEVIDLTDKEYMQMALKLAEEGRGYTSPNPIVGCVIVDEAGTVVGRGYHHKAGEAHAEVNALAQAQEKAKGATVYVTLEPCAHVGRTGPCCDALIAAGVKRVVIAAKDPNPKVAGQGIARMKAAGIKVEQGVLAEEAYMQNEIFMHWMISGMPFVAMKYAMTLDGKLATYTGDAKWITGETARAYGHLLRHEYDAILVGKRTVLVDDPELTCRLVDGNNPIRVVLDSNLEIPRTCKLVNDSKAPTIIVTGKDVPAKKVAAFTSKPGVRVMQVPLSDGEPDLKYLLSALGRENITSVLVEGGSAVHGSFFDAGLVQRVYAFIAPKLIGGSNNISPVGGKGKSVISAGYVLHHQEVKTFDSEIMVTGRIGKELRPCSQD